MSYRFAVLNGASELQGRERCKKIGIDPDKSIFQLSEEQIDKMFSYLHQNRIPFNTMMPVNSLNASAILNLFRCKRCGKCCLEIGDIPLHKGEAKGVAEYLGKSHKSIKNLTITEKRGRKLTTPCPFYKDGCSIQAVKPLTCRLFPISDPIFIQGQAFLQLSTFCDAGINLAKTLLKYNKRSRY